MGPVLHRLPPHGIAMATAKTPWRRHYNFQCSEARLDCPHCKTELIVTVNPGPSGEHHVITCGCCAGAFLVVK